jgi:Flp pilus assembly protein TadG
MIRTFRRLFSCADGTAAVEAAIFAPIFLLLVLGVTDLGSAMFKRMTVNAAAQAGASYAVIHYGDSCATMTPTCLSGIQAAMNNAIGNSSFCTGTVCTASFTACADANGGICFIVSANYLCGSGCLILPDAVYSWASPMTYSSSITVRVPVAS